MNASSRRYLSVWLRRLSTDRIARRSPAPADAPRVIAASIKSALRISTLDDAAARRGLKTGMPLADARAMFPGIEVFDADEEADRALLEAIADWCDRYTPLVALDPPDGIVLDVTGCVHLFGGEDDLVRDILTRLARQGLQARAAIADTVGGAWAVARYGSLSVVPKGHVRETVAPLPAAALRLEPETVAGLAQLGLKTIADVIARPRAPLAARFGAEVVRSLDRILGREDEPVSPRLPVPAAIAEQRFADPIGLEADVLGTIEQLAHRLAHLLERRGEGVRLVQATLFRTDGKVYRVEIGTAAPLRDPVHVRRLFADRLATLGDECDPGFGFDMMRLSVLASERLDHAQMGLNGADPEQALTHLIDRLGARFGLRRVCRLVPQDTHIPEYAVMEMPAHVARVSSQLSQHSPEQDSLAPVRPIRLFARPEEVFETFAEVPDGPPARFRWRNVLHEITRAEGPERIAMQWWRDEEGRSLTRDYFRVESKTGGRLWLYREGLFGREIEHPRWFVHGMFA